MVTIRSLSDLRKEEQKKKEKNMSHYTGGQKSGLAVEDSDDDFDVDVFHKALGDNYTHLTVYKNGFIVDNGEFRDLAEEDNKRFMLDINAGKVPKELSGKGMNLRVALKDKRNQMYVKKNITPESVYKGEGKRLGGNTTDNSNNNNNNESKNENETANTTEIPKELKKINVDESKPITTLQIRLYNGKRLTQKFNLEHTIEDLFQFIESASPISTFRLLYDFPPKEVTRSDKTLGDAELVNVTITQKKE